MKKYEIDEQTLVNVLNYLVSRPYKEVAKGIQSLQNLKEIKVSNKEIKTPNNDNKEKK